MDNKQFQLTIFSDCMPVQARSLFMIVGLLGHEALKLTAPKDKLIPKQA